ncbi:MAG: glycosyltransferase [Nitrospirae bacterium]|nr:glycosyltransferase [Nitrospirota bacterium]
MSDKPKISVILTAHNYAKFLGQAIDSVLNQTCQEFELIIAEDGSTDHTDEVLEKYTKHPKVRVVRLKGVGLAAACNAAIRESRGQYIIRLDADDYFDENALLVESRILDSKPEVHLVYSDYFKVDYSGNIIEHYRLMKSNDEIKLLDRAPLGAGAMYRKQCYDEIGGYNEELKYQEDYDFWLRFINRFNVYNVRLPLMYYRRHEGTMSTNSEKRSMARRHVKHEFVREKVGADRKVIGLIRESVFLKKSGIPKIALADINGMPLINYSLNALMECEYMQDVYILTDDEEVEEIAVKYGAKSLGLHPKGLASPTVTRGEVVSYFVREMDKRGHSMPDIMATISINCPFIKSYHLTEAIDTMLIHDYDSVISVMEHYDFYWRPGPSGLVPFGYDRKIMKEDSDTLYLETGGIRIVKTKNLLGKDWLGNSIGFIELSQNESIEVVNNEFSIWLASQIMKEGYLDRVPKDKYLYEK